MGCRGKRDSMSVRTGASSGRPGLRRKKSDAAGRPFCFERVVLITLTLVTAHPSSAFDQWVVASTLETAGCAGLAGIGKWSGHLAPAESLNSDVG